MSRKPQQRTIRTRASILDAARTLSAELGIETVTAEAVAARAGVAKGTVFAHFGDMDGLLSYVLLDRLQALQARPEDGAPSPAAFPAGFPGDPVGLLLERMMALIAVITENPTILRLFLDNIGVTKPHCAPDFVATLDALDADLAAFLALWQETPEAAPLLRQDRTPAELVDGLIAFMIHGAILFTSHQLADRDLLRARLRRHVEAFVLA